MRDSKEAAKELRNQDKAPKSPTREQGSSWANLRKVGPKISKLSKIWQKMPITSFQALWNLLNQIVWKVKLYFRLHPKTKNFHKVILKQKTSKIPMPMRINQCLSLLLKSLTAPIPSFRLVIVARESQTRNLLIYTMCKRIGSLASRKIIFKWP